MATDISLNKLIINVLSNEQYEAAEKNSGELYLVPDKDITETTWANLKTLRDGSNLVPGSYYRITDYTCVTCQENTKSAGHQFDIIVQALDTNKLSEEARATQHAGDTYFANSNLGVWKIWYCLDNDTSRFSWVQGSDEEHATYDGDPYYYDSFLDTEINNVYYYGFSDGNTSIVYSTKRYPENYDTVYTLNNGTMIQEDSWISDYVFAEKGVIYRMIDEFGNDCPYDFKNIQFTRKLSGSELDNSNGTDTWCYTFTLYSVESDDYHDFSIYGDLHTDDGGIIGCRDNKIGSCSVGRSGYLGGPIKLNNNVFFGIYSDINDHSSSDEYSDMIGNCLGLNCSYNTFGIGCIDNTFDIGCVDNTFGNFCSGNTLKANCETNFFHGNDSNNTLDVSCYNIHLGINCNSNSFGIYNGGVNLGNYCDCNTFGSNCEGIYFGSSINNRINYVRYVSIKSNCSDLCITSTDTTANSSNYLQNVEINSGTKAFPGSNLNIVIPNRNLQHTTKVGYDSSGNLQIYCEEDNSNTIIENEKVTAMALNDLNSRFDSFLEFTNLQWKKIFSDNVGNIGVLPTYIYVDDYPEEDMEDILSANDCSTHYELFNAVLNDIEHTNCFEYCNETFTYDGVDYPLYELVGGSNSIIYGLLKQPLENKTIENDLAEYGSEYDYYTDRTPYCPFIAFLGSDHSVVYEVTDSNYEASHDLIKVVIED